MALALAGGVMLDDNGPGPDTNYPRPALCGRDQ